MKPLSKKVWLDILLLTFSAQAQWTINGVNYDANGRSEIVWTDDGSYGLQVFTQIDQFGNLRIVEYAKVTDFNFTRNSFKLNTAYNFEPLNAALVANGVASNATAAGLLPSRRLDSDGTLDTGNGWFLVVYGDGTTGVEHLGRDWRVPTLGDYAVRRPISGRRI